MVNIDGRAPVQHVRYRSADTYVSYPSGCDSIHPCAAGKCRAGKQQHNENEKRRVFSLTHTATQQESMVAWHGLDFNICAASANQVGLRRLTGDRYDTIAIFSISTCLACNPEMVVFFSTCLACNPAMATTGKPG